LNRSFKAVLKFTKRTHISFVYYSVFKDQISAAVSLRQKQDYTQSLSTCQQLFSGKCFLKIVTAKPHNFFFRSAEAPNHTCSTSVSQLFFSRLLFFSKERRLR